MIREVLYATGITATAGIGTNLYLAKLAMDITAKHAAPDKDGVRIAELDEESSGICSGIISLSRTSGRLVPAPSADWKAWHSYDG